jgi:hypothetical protein
MTDPNLWSELEDLNLTTDWLASTLVARKLEGVNFALGTTIAVTPSRLTEIGGFSPRRRRLLGHSPGGSLGYGFRLRSVRNKGPAPPQKMVADPLTRCLRVPHLGGRTLLEPGLVA